VYVNAFMDETRFIEERYREVIQLAQENKLDRIRLTEVGPERIFTTC
jgi:hypothetical protein